MHVVIGLDNLQAAERIYERIEARARILSANPRSGPRRGDIRTGMRVLVENPYLIFYGNCPGTPRFERENRSVRQRTPMPIRLCSRPDSISFSRRHRPIVPWVSKIGGTWAVTEIVASDDLAACRYAAP